MSVRRATREDKPAIKAMDVLVYKDDPAKVKLTHAVKKYYLYIVDGKPTAYIHYMLMPNKDRDLYIISLAGKKPDRIKLVKYFQDKFPNHRHYTHGKPAWDTPLLLKAGFKKTIKGDPKDEVVDFYWDLTKLYVYEWRKPEPKKVK